MLRGLGESYFPRETHIAPRIEAEHKVRVVMTSAMHYNGSCRKLAQLQLWKRMSFSPPRGS